MEKYILLFQEIRKQDIAIAGGKGANLGEMVNAGIAVPPGAVLCANAYERYMEENHISASDILEQEKSTEEATQAIREKILNGVFPEEVRSQIACFYKSLGENVRVAVRSSATAEDLEDASFAGQQETYLNVIGEEMLFAKIKECYASLWANRAVSYRKKQGYDKQKVALAIVIQQMIESEYAGVLFTKNPASNTDEVLINASYGLGEAVVSGLVSPDEYRCDRSGNVKLVTIGSKEKQIVYGKIGTETIFVPVDMQKRQVLTKEQISSLVLNAMEIEKHYGHPMDIEWAVRDNEIYILQARSITTLSGDETIVFTEEDFSGLPKVKPAKGSMRENILFNLEKLPRMFKQMKDYEYNVRVSTEKYEECKRRLSKETLMETNTIQQTGESLFRMRQLISDTAYARFRYAIFPQVIENKGLNRILAKVDDNLNSYDLLEGLSYVTTDVNRSMKELVTYIRENVEVEKAVSNLSYEEIIHTYPDLAEKFEEFMQKYGNRSDFNCYCFVAKSWKDEPERFWELCVPYFAVRILAY